jgi:hypothetical protein
LMPLHSKSASQQLSKQMLHHKLPYLTAAMQNSQRTFNTAHCQCYRWIHVPWTPCVNYMLLFYPSIALSSSNNHKHLRNNSSNNILLVNFMFFSLVLSPHNNKRKLWIHKKQYWSLKQVKSSTIILMGIHL